MSIEQQYGVVIEYIDPQAGFTRAIALLIYVKNGDLHWITPGYTDPYNAMPSVRRIKGVTINQGKNGYFIDTELGHDGTIEKPNTKEQEAIDRWYGWLKERNLTPEQEWKNREQEIL